jgi:hypothetical protein
MIKHISEKAHDDDLIEPLFFRDYSIFALKMNLLAITSILRASFLNHSIVSIGDTVSRLPLYRFGGLTGS